MDRHRYLNKLCDQLVCLLSGEHSKALVWSSVDTNKADEECDGDGDDEDGDGTSTDSDSDRFGSFEVAKTKDQEENVAVRAGFVVSQRVNQVRDSSVTQISVIARCTLHFLLIRLRPPIRLSIQALYIRRYFTVKKCKVL
jgi:hypothetical protein